MNKFHQQRRYNKRSGRRFGSVNKQALLSQAQRLHDKYLKDAQVASESYYKEYYMQHADHYYRVIRSLQEEDTTDHEDDTESEGDIDPIDQDKLDDKEELSSSFISNKKRVSTKELVDATNKENLGKEDNES